MRHIIILVQQVVVGSRSEVVLICMYECTFICMSATRLWMKYTSLNISLHIPFHVCTLCG